MPSPKLTIPGARGIRLAARIEAPQATPRGWAIFAHCFTCGKDSAAAVRVSRALALAGIGVVRFDFAGLGGSDGEFADSSFASNVDDLIAVARDMDAQGRAPSLLVGHSLGGAAALAAATEIDSVRAVATIGAPASVDHLLGQFGPAAITAIAEHGEAEVILAGRPFNIRREFVEDARQQDLETRIARLGKPLLVMHAPGDTVVGIDNATRIFSAARHPKSFISLDDANHLLSHRPDADYAAAVIAAWASRYLPTQRADIPDTVAIEGVTAQETGEGNYQLSISSGRHRLLADEPISVGGLDSGMSPYELVSAGLAACTVMTMRMYANRKGLPLKRARIRVVHSKRPDQSPADVFTRHIHLQGDLDDAQRARLLEIADRCPVDLTLIRGSDVETTLLSDDAWPVAG
ncbi:TPA: alpha/beta fold hydrolase [Stenotrophomonas maltophilia]|uniref:Alpha/beta fold hydrolase n=1 Tax=Stenotrophomonas maltophilia TaxID=40324 RepID=A0AAJ2JAE3_STEMA|nr:alpha/beta fold hydrolase [Stenotrophomonas maltophilia]MDT3468333.1 alpha/beta fold hydrolase [Stenotrophomonas maltophilia]